MTPQEKVSILYLEKVGVISTSEKNLRSKIESIVRSLENLQTKQERINYEIRKQKRSLARKREELKRVSKGNRARTTLTMESVADPSKLIERSSELSRLDSYLLQESSRLLDI